MEQQSKPTLISPTAGQRGMTELHYAAYCNDADDVREQLLRGFDVDVRDDNGWTALHWSIDMAEAGGEPEEVVSLLLAAGASVNAVDQSGFSILMMACGRNNLVLLERLIEAGANIHLKTEDGITALHEAACCDFTKGIGRLLILGADPKAVDKWNRTPEDIAEQSELDEITALFRAANGPR